MSAIAIFTARKNSTRIPGKNKRLFRGMPIITYPIRAAKLSNIFDKIVISTDDEEIRDIGWSEGCAYLEREPEFAENDVGTKQVMARCVDMLSLKDNDIVACIYPCAPFICERDLHWGVNLLVLRPAYFVVAVGTEPLADAGAFYFSLAGHWKDDYLPIYGQRTAYYHLPPTHVCDINVEDDWLRAERMYADLHKESA